MSIPLIGCDPEVFLWDEKNKLFVSAAGKFPGTKKEPHKVEKGAIQVDGVALEFNISPAASEDEFFENIVSVHTTMTNMVKGYNPDWSIRHTPFAAFSEEVWKDVPAESRELGCDPDYESFTGRVKPNPGAFIQRGARNYNVNYGSGIKGRQEAAAAIRTASGHIHIGFASDDLQEPDNPLHFEDCRFVANYFANKGFLRPQKDHEYTRLNYYGGQGAFRAKPYGVELRSPSNCWLGPVNGMLSENSIRQAYRSAISIFQEMESKYAQ